MLNTSAPRDEELGLTEPIDDTKKRRLPIAPHSERSAFIGAGYWFFWMKPLTLSKLPISCVLQSAKYASRTGAVPNLSSPSMLSIIVYALLLSNARTTVSTSDRVISVGLSPSTPPVQLMKEAVPASMSRVKTSSVWRSDTPRRAAASLSTTLLL